MSDDRKERAMQKLQNNQHKAQLDSIKLKGESELKEIYGFNTVTASKVVEAYKEEIHMKEKIQDAKEFLRVQNGMVDEDEVHDCIFKYMSAYRTAKHMLEQIQRGVVIDKDDRGDLKHMYQIENLLDYNKEFMRKYLRRLEKLGFTGDLPELDEE